MHTLLVHQMHDWQFVAQWYVSCILPTSALRIVIALPEVCGTLLLMHIVHSVHIMHQPLPVQQRIMHHPMPLRQGLLLQLHCQYAHVYRLPIALHHLPE